MRDIAIAPSLHNKILRKIINKSFLRYMRISTMTSKYTTCIFKVVHLWHHKIPLTPAFYHSLSNRIFNQTRNSGHSSNRTIDYFFINEPNYNRERRRYTYTPCFGWTVIRVNRNTRMQSTRCYYYLLFVYDRPRNTRDFFLWRFKCNSISKKSCFWFVFRPQCFSQVSWITVKHFPRSLGQCSLFCKWWECGCISS